MRKAPVTGYSQAGGLRTAKRSPDARKSENYKQYLMSPTPPWNRSLITSPQPRPTKQSFQKEHEVDIVNFIRNKPKPLSKNHQHQ